LIYYYFNAANIPLQFSMLLGLITFPFVIQSRNDKGGYRYAVLAFLMALVLVFFRSSSIYYFVMAFTVLFVLDNWWGRLNHLPFLLCIIVSPLLNNLVYTWSFPIRLQLTKWAGQALQWINMDIQVNGNVLILDGHTFSVDPACMGLKMLITSLVIGVLILAYFERKKQYTLSFMQASLWLFFIFMAAILANFIRLFLLIIFHILPDNFLHDIAGLISLGVYALLPFYFLVKYFFSKKQANIPSTKNEITNSKIPLLIFLGLLSFQIFTGRQFTQIPIENVQAVANIELDGFKKTITKKGILKFQNEEVLIYIKPPVQFFQGSHDPRFCWQGSGYTFSDIAITDVGDQFVYTAKLTKADDQLYTAWWYQNEDQQTVYEWDWRWKNFTGNGDFYLVSVSSLDEGRLLKWIREVLNEKL